MLSYICTCTTTMVLTVNISIANSHKKQLAKQVRGSAHLGVLKKGPHGPELIWNFCTKLAKNTQLSFSGPYFKAHDV